MKTLRIRIETNRLLPNGSKFDYENIDGLTVSQTVERLNSEGLTLSAEDIECVGKEYTIRHWVGPTIFKQVHLFTA